MEAGRLRLPSHWQQRVGATLAVMFGIVAGIDIVGTPLAIVAINNANQFAKKANSAVVHAREEDCRSSEKLRELARKRIDQKERELPQTLALLHLQPTPTLLAVSRRNFATERESVTPVDCIAYARKAQP